MAVLKVPVKGGGMLEVETKDITDNDVYNAIMLLGFKDALNRGMTKIGKLKVSPETSEADVEAAKAKAMEIAAKNLEGLKSGKMPRMVGVKSSDGKVPGVVMTEARRLARNVIKDQIKAAGEKISHYEAKDITAAANALLKLDEGKEILVQAQKNVDERNAKTEALPKESVETLASKLGLTVSAKKVAKAQEEKANKAKKGEALLSATQAGQTAKRSQQPQAKAN